MKIGESMVFISQNENVLYSILTFVRNRLLMNKYLYNLLVELFNLLI